MQPPAPSPQPPRRRLLVVTALLLSLWLVATLFAEPLSPVVAAAAERVEVALGLDRARGDELEDEA